MTSLDILGAAYCSSNDSSSETDEYSENIDTSQKPKLPLPGVIKTLFSDSGRTTNDPSQHQGRVRTFEHVRGNWATCIYVPYPEMYKLEFFHSIKSVLRDVGASGAIWKPVDDIHLSISKTVTIPHHFIEPMVDSLQDGFKACNSFTLTLSPLDLKYYVNDEQTRSFCGFEVTHSNMIKSIAKLVEKVDETMSDFNCDTYYIEPSYHISIAWCLGDVLKDGGECEILENMKQLWNNIQDNHNELFSFNVNKIVFKTGNKQFLFNLS